MSPRPAFRQFLTAGVLAAAVSVVVNAALFWIARAVGAWSMSVRAPTGGPIGLAEVALLSVGPAIVGTLLAWLLISFVPRGRTVFLAIAALVLVVFLFPPLQLGAPAGMVVVLQAMHLVVAAATVGFALRAAGQAGS